MVEGSPLLGGGAPGVTSTVLRHALHQYLSHDILLQLSDIPQQFVTFQQQVRKSVIFVECHGPVLLAMARLWSLPVLSHNGDDLVLCGAV